MTAGQALLSALRVALEEDPGTAAEVAALLAQHLAPAAAEGDDRGWLDARAAAAYLGLPLDGLHKLTGARALRFSQERPGAKCYFRRADLDAYRERHLQGREP